MPHSAAFSTRHIGSNPAQRDTMLTRLGYDTLDELTDAVLPPSISHDAPLQLPAAVTEAEAAKLLAGFAEANHPATSMIGLGYHGTITPPVIRRNVLENPAWYTAYTPYQPEISQGRLEALITFQTMICDLTGLQTSNASLLDEATAVAEAVSLARRTAKKGSVLLLDAQTLPQTVSVVQTRARGLGIDVVVVDGSVSDGALVQAIQTHEAFAVVVQTPGKDGGLPAVSDLRAVADKAHENGALVIAACDLLSLVIGTEPQAWGADIAVGSSQRFGVPLFYGGPHAGFIAVRSGLERALPGRLVGASVDAAGTTAYRLALQTREQHIRRDRATSNICTAQVLLAVVAAMYAVYHGPDGLKRIAGGVHRGAKRLAASLSAVAELETEAFFDTLTVRVPGRADAVIASARERGVQLRRVDADRVGISVGQDATEQDLEAVAHAFGASLGSETVGGLGDHRRESEFCTHPVFSRFRSETSMLRFLRGLSDRDFALDRGMIPLGSCTMKLNATTEMEPISLPGFANLHPFAPADDARGYRQLIDELEAMLAEVTGYHRVSIQPNAGSQGEFAGLMAIHAYHAARGDEGRNVCLIPSSAHGTNAASAVMAGLRVVVVKATAAGSVDLDDLRAKIETHGEQLAAIMVTYPSTHGVFEETIVELCELVHEAGGQVYVDGANLNALLGLAKPGDRRFGADVSHLNLHKTFCIPHGGGGPGVGPVGVAEHLAPYLPNHPMAAEAGPDTGVGAISAAPYGSAGILPISWAYIAMMGPDGLREATQHAILAANYVANRLAEHYPILYSGQNGLVAHECILDLRPITKSSGVTVDDVAKRLVDYGFHAPTMSFPVPGTLMVEPTESENLIELDRLCEAMIAIRAEIADVEAGTIDKADNPLANAPHTLAEVTATEWSHPYSREVAAFPAGRHLGPLGAGGGDKYWPAVARVDGAYGDRNLVCSCPPLEDYDG